MATRPGGIDDLTPREMEVLRLLGTGLVRSQHWLRGWK